MCVGWFCLRCWIGVRLRVSNTVGTFSSPMNLTVFFTALSLRVFDERFFCVRRE